MREKVNNAYLHTKRVFNNTEQFVQAVALLVVAVTAFDYQNKNDLNEIVRGVVVVSLVIISLRGAYELFKFLDKEEVK